jgi:SPP1 gp7 family putative phage head morphogenesis protein
MKYEEFKVEIPWLDRVFIERFLGTSDLSKLTKEDVEALREIRDRGFSITGVEEEKLLKEANFIIDSAIRSGLTTAEAVSQLREKMELLREKYNAGRMNFFTSKEVEPMVEAFQYQAILDDNTTAFCRAHDGQVIKSGDGRVAQINPPNHFNCRSVLVPILVGDNKNEDSFYNGYKDDKEAFPPFGADVPKDATQPEIGFGGSGNK